jgi:hypothetical protein
VLNVDQSRHDELTFDIEDHSGAGGNILPDRFDAAVADQNIEPAVAPGSGIEQPSAFQEKTCHS